MTLAGLRNRLLKIPDRATRRYRQRAAIDIYEGRTPDRMTRLIVRAYFEAAAGLWRTRGRNVGRHEPLLAALDGIPAPARAIEIGCGTGGAAAAVAERFPDAEVTGIDIASRMVRFARREHPLPNLGFRRGDVEAVPFPDGSFDLVVLHNAPAHLPELRRITHPGSCVALISTEGTVGPEAHRSPSDHGFEVQESGVVGGANWTRWVRVG